MYFRGIVVMFRNIVVLNFILIFSVQSTNAQLRDYLTRYVEDESAPGARAAMGILAAGYGKALAREVFDFPLNTWENRLTSLGIAALSYQIISYDTYEGLRINPFKFNKEWTGYWEGYAIGEGLDLFLGFVNQYDVAKFIIASTTAILMSIVIVKGEASGGFRMADDGPFSIDNLFKNRHSWWVHFAASGGLYWAISNHTATEESALLHTLPVIWLWEVKDGYLPWEEYGWIGGDGFSWRDGVAGSIAVVGSYAIDKWVFPFIKNNLLPKNSLISNHINYALYPDIKGGNIRLDINVRF
jgi:hypothetical protein